jgi:hypothetical protein
MTRRLNPPRIANPTPRVGTRSVWTTRQVPALHPKSISHGVEKTADGHLRLCVTSPNSAHVGPARTRNIVERRSSLLAWDSLVAHDSPMETSRSRSGERRWIVLAEDGRYSSLGRATDPTQEEVAAAEAALAAQGVKGWLAVMQGNPYVGKVPRLMEVRPLAEPTKPFTDAAEACVRGIVAGRGATK